MLVNNETKSNDINGYSSFPSSSLGIFLIRLAAGKVTFSNIIFMQEKSVTF